MPKTEPDLEGAVNVISSRAQGVLDRWSFMFFAKIAVLKVVEIVNPSLWFTTFFVRHGGMNIYL